jgi:hypothetical protein
MNPVGRIIRHIGFCLRDPARMGGSYKRRERFNNAVFISPRRDFLFTKSEKCGNVTMRRSLQNLVAEKPLPPHFKDVDRWFAPLLQPSDLRLKHIAEINAIPYKFAVVRNPYSRLLSYYLNARRRKFHWLLGADKNMDFGGFVRLVVQQAPEEMNPHWRVQHHNLFCEVIEYDHFARFEQIEEELQAFMSRYKPDAEIRSVHKNQSRAGGQLATYYTPELTKLVRDKYAIDFEYFGYPVELPA